MILLSWNVQSRIAVEFANAAEMDITTQQGDSDRMRKCQILQSMNETVSLMLMVLCCPMITKFCQWKVARPNTVRLTLNRQEARLLRQTFV